MPRGLQQSIDLGAPATPVIELLELLPSRHHVARELENPHQAQQSQGAQHFHVHDEQTRKVKRCDRQQVHTGIKAQGIVPARKAASRVLGVQGRRGQAQKIFQREDRDASHIENVKPKLAPGVNRLDVLGNDGHHAENDEPTHAVLHLAVVAAFKRRIEQPLVNQRQKACRARLRGGGGVWQRVTTEKFGVRNSRRPVFSDA